MPIRKLDHYNLLTLKLDETVRFYTSVLGMKSGPFPGSDATQGAWIYDDAGFPVIHIQAVDPKNPEAKLLEVNQRLGALADNKSVAALGGTGSIEHVAFECDEYEGFVERFEKSGALTKKNDIPSFNLRQLFVNDPNGVTIELNFRS